MPAVLQRGVVFVVALTALSATPLAAQDLVLHKDGTKTYHRPWCPAVRDARDVLALSRAQANGRGLKPHADCDRDPPRSLPQPDVSAPAAPVFVYVPAAKATHYHRNGCKRLGRDPKKLSLEVAGRQYWPCPVCKPPVRKRKS